MKHVTGKFYKNKSEFFKKEMNEVAGILFNDNESMAGLKAKFENYDMSGKAYNTFYSPWNTFRMFLRQILSQDHSCRNAISLAIAEAHALGNRIVTPDTGNYCKARQKIPEGLIKDLALDLGKAQHQTAKASWLWKGKEVNVIDGSTIDMPDTPKNQKAYPQPTSQRKGLGFPKIRLVAVLSLATASILDFAFGKYSGKKTGEISLLKPLIKNFKAGSIALADAIYCTYTNINDFQNKNVDVVFPLHGARLPGGFFSSVDTLKDPNDSIVEWVKPQRSEVVDNDEYRTLPNSLILREVKVNGKYYVTTLLDREKYSRFAIAELYKMRYSSVEVDLRSIKDVMQLDFLRCLKPDMVKKEIWMHILGLGFKQ